MLTIPFFMDIERGKLGTTKLVTAAPDIGSRGPWQMMLNISKDDQEATPLIVSLRTEYSTAEPTVSGGAVPGPDPVGTSQIGGPLVGRVEWGVGGGKNIVDFDLQCPKLPDLIAPVTFPLNQPIEDSGGGVQLCVSASSLTVYVRNDGNLSPVNAPDQDRIGSPLPAKIICFVSPGSTRGGTPLQRTIVVAGGIDIGFPLVPLAIVNVPIPTFARRVNFCRIPIANTALRVTTQNNFGATLREFHIPANSEGPMRLQGNEVSLRLENTSATDIDELQAVFDVDPI